MGNIHREIRIPRDMVGKVEKNRKRSKSSESNSSPKKKNKTEKSPKKNDKNLTSPKKAKTNETPEKKSRSEGPTAYSKGTIRSIIQRANPEMQISANVPQTISNAALQFTALLSQTALEASIRRRTQPQGKTEYSISYSDVASVAQADPRLEAIHDNVPHKISHQAALIQRAELLA